jgi:precorrin-3B C17-methyltransferase
MYNVQSAGRQQGVYRVLQLMLESKAPHTLCGVVKNAYRPGQQVSIHRLDELPSLQFDMLTTIVVGNRFTQRKRGSIYTPRGYNDWALPEGAVGSAAAPVASAPQRAALPDDAAWVFSGTSDGNALAAVMAAQLDCKVVVSAATEHGGALALKDSAHISVWAGRQGVEARRQALAGSRARVLVDATHPYASAMSEQLIGLSRELGIPYLRYERASQFVAGDGELCASPQLAAERAIACGERIFLSTGSKDLATFLQAPGAAGKQWFVRLTAEPEFIERALALGVPRERICAMQGPFSSAFNSALWRDWGIDCVVTKDSGSPGGYRAKADTARMLGIALIVVARPQLSYPRLATSNDDVLRQLRTLDIA